MGFLKSLLKRADQEPAAQKPGGFSDLYNGMKVEILDPANTLIFVGRLQVLGDDCVEVRGESGSFLPRALYNQPVKLRAFQRDGSAFTMDGNVGPNGTDFWRIERLRYLHSKETRGFFRQNTEVDGWVHSTVSDGQKSPCTVLDISGGGARVVTERLFALGATFQLETSLLPGEAPFTIPCQVKRIQTRPAAGRSARKFEYGCQFMELPQREQDRLLQSIFTLQRKALQSRRDQ